MKVNIGTAGWTIPRTDAERFPPAGTALERYSAVLPVAEINSSFHRPHRISTWQRWHDSVPNSFRFSVKLPKVITHQRKLVDSSDAIDAFVEQVSALADKFAVLLVQLPPKLAFEDAVAAPFFRQLRDRIDAAIACEPRNPSWFTSAVDALLNEWKVARVAADPSICEAAAEPGGWRQLSYTRLHGSPVMYRSSYADRVSAYAERLREDAAMNRDCWCIFDNTASSAAMGDALALMSITKS